MAVDKFLSLISNSLHLRFLYVDQKQIIGGHIDWYVDPEDESATSIAITDKIVGNDFRGWVTYKTVVKNERYQRVTLKRVSDTAMEGRFTCSIPKDSDSPRGLLILHPSESI